MLKGVKALYFEVLSVGKRIKSSKKRFTWKFKLEEQDVTVDLFVRKFSGKRTIKVDGDIKFEGKKSGTLFSFPFHLATHLIIVMEVDKSYDLKIDSISFQTLYRQSSALGMKNYESWEAEDISPHVGSQFRDRSETWTGAGAWAPGRKTSFEDFQIEDWEKYAKPYKIVQREIYQTAIREKLPIKPHPKSELLLRDSINNPFEFAEDYDSRFVFRPKTQSDSYINPVIQSKLANMNLNNDWQDSSIKKPQDYSVSHFSTYNPNSRSLNPFMI